MLNRIYLTNQIKHSKVMKKVTKHERILRAVIILLALFGLTVTICRAQSPKKYTRQGDNFIELGSSTKSVARDSTKSGYTYTTKDGQTYTIWLSPKGRAYIGRTSKKTGKYYRQYMPKEIEDTMYRENL